MFGGDEDGSYLKGGGVESMRLPLCGLCYMEASGVLGGILLMWDRRVVEKVEECVGRYKVACSLGNTVDNVV
jgi:hypothetical protein